MNEGTPANWTRGPAGADPTSGQETWVARLPEGANLEEEARAYLATMYDPEWSDPYSSRWTPHNKDMAVGHLVQWAQAQLEWRKR